MPDNFHNEIPQHRALGKSVDPEKVLEKAAGILNCDLDYIRHSLKGPILLQPIFKRTSDLQSNLIVIRPDAVPPEAGLWFFFP